MIEAEIYAGFSIRRLQGGGAVAVLHLLCTDGLGSADEAIFDEASLVARVRNLQRAGYDAAVSEAALRALRTARGAPDAVPDALATLRPSLPSPAEGDPPHRSGLDLLRDAIERAAQAALDRFEPGPCLLLMTPRNLDRIAACRGEDASRLAMMGVAERLADNLRRVDRLARLDATRFGACVPRLAPDDAEALAERMRRAVACAPFEAPGGPIALWLETEVLACPVDRSLAPAALTATMIAMAEDRLRESQAAGDAVVHAA